MNVKVFNLIWREKETRFLVEPESCDCKLNKMYAYAKINWDPNICDFKYN